MKPEIISRDSFSVLGLSRWLAPEDQNEQAFKSIWSEFEVRLEEIRVHSIDGAFYGISFSGDQPGSVDYLATMAVDSSTPVPVGLVMRRVPKSRYAVFECPVQSIGETYRFVFNEWLPGSSLELSLTAPVFERYPPEGKESWPVLIHIPIKEAA
jgi:predicted transcriptional regulator YdeE